MQSAIFDQIHDNEISTELKRDESTVSSSVVKEKLHTNVSESQVVKKAGKKKVNRLLKMDLEDLLSELTERSTSLNIFLDEYPCIDDAAKNTIVSSDCLELSSKETADDIIEKESSIADSREDVHKEDAVKTPFQIFADDVQFIREASIYGRGSQMKRMAVGEHMHEIGVDSLMMNIWNRGLVVEFLQSEHKIICNAMKGIMIAVWNSSDRSKNLSQNLLNNKIYLDIFRYLRDERLKLTSEDSSNEIPRLIPIVYFTKGLLGILHNLVNHCPDARESFRDANAVDLFFGYKSVRNLMIKCKANMLLANIINEDESERVFADTRSVGFIVGILSNAMNSADRHSKKYGFHAGELINGMNKMAANDSNKVRIIEAGALPHYVRLLKSDCTSREQSLAAEGIWIFAFRCSETIRNNEECIPALKDLVAESNHSEVKRMASGALWVLNMVHTNFKQFSSIADKQNDILTSLAVEKQSEEGKEEGIQHIMLSYEWSIQPMMLKVKEFLASKGYKVWMDVDYMSGSILEAMALAVENASVVITALSQKYKESPNCRTEAEYAFKCNRSIVPLRVEGRYRPDGWLGALTANKLYFDLSEGRDFNRAMGNLMKELGERGKLSPNLEPKVQARKETPCTVEKTSEKTSIHLWNNCDVKKWMEENKLNQHINKFTDFNGDLLIELMNMRHDAPEYYHKCLMEKFSFSLCEVLHLSSCLKKL